MNEYFTMKDEEPAEWPLQTFQDFLSRYIHNGQANTTEGDQGSNTETQLGDKPNRGTTTPVLHHFY